MAKLQILAVSTALAVSCVPLAACVELKTNADVTFSNMEVTVERTDGWPDSRGAIFKIKGLVTNTSDHPVSSNNLPVLVEGDGDENMASISQDKLSPGETCNVTYTGSVPMADGEVSSIDATGTMSYTGLNEVVQELNKDLSGIAEQDATEDNERESASQKRAQALEELGDAEGKTASEVLAICKDGHVSYRFEDSFGVDVTSEVEDAEEDSEILQAVVRRALVRDSQASFMLDYTDQVAKGEREWRVTDKAATERARRDLADCTGKTAAEALELAETAHMHYKFLDSAGVDVTRMVKGSRAGSEASSLIVAEVEIDEGGLYTVGFVTFVLDYTDEAEAAKQSDFQADQARIKRVFENSVDRTVAEVVELAEAEGIEYKLMDAWNKDVTDRAMEEGYAGWRSRAVVTLAMVTARSAIFHLNIPLTLTAQDNDELSDLLSLGDPYDEACAAFAAKYKGHVMEFDGYIASATRHGSYNTRYDYLVKAGNFADSELRGPDFKLEDVSLYDLGVTGDFPDGIDTGTNLHFCAEVVEYNGKSGFFYLKPVQTTAR